METIEFIPRLLQMRKFIEACEIEPNIDRKHLFTSLMELTDEDVDFLLFNGMIPLDSSLDAIHSTLQLMDNQKVELFISDTLVDLNHNYPSGHNLSVGVYPMDENDQFGRNQMGGVSAWTDYAGDSIHLVVYPANETIHALRSTVVHEYNHHYRITALDNGHSNLTLLEYIIREGLVEHFVADILGGDFCGPWVNALTEEDAKRYWATLYSVHARDCDDIGQYIFGGRNTDIPLWAGYSMGYYLVKWYRQLHHMASIIDLTVQNCEDFIPSSLDF